MKGFAKTFNFLDLKQLKLLINTAIIPKIKLLTVT